MSFKIRNSIALGAVWLVFTAAGAFYYSYWQPRQLKKIAKDMQDVTKQLADLPGLTEEVQSLTVQFQDVRRRYDSRSKEIPSSDISSQTYAYMSRGIDAAGFLQFDMKFLGTDDRSVWGYNAYKLEQGEAQFDNLYRFVYFLENGRRLYKIATLKLVQNEGIDPDTKETTRWIAFDMELHAYYVKNIPELATSLAAKSMTQAISPSDPFRPLILKTISNEAPEGQIDVDKCEVKAILPGKAFVLFNSEMNVLHIGDKVWRGYVSRISPAKSSIEFTLNEGGVIRKLEKKIMFDRRIRKREP
ncbi:MAG TPA: hypothetical protein VMM57_04675 [Bacteroidota bacterium]|nr:hypothetical protein [Bacteroidota bacterium]